jgi:hypothetical protein
MKEKITAEIIKEDDSKHGLTLLISYQQNEDEDTVWALTEDEVLPIYTALQDYMVKGKREK